MVKKGKTKLVFSRTNFQTRENRAARRNGENIESDGVEWHEVSIHFPPTFFTDLVSGEKRKWILSQVVHGTKGVRKGELSSRPLPSGDLLLGTSKRDIFYQLAKFGFEVVLQKENEGGSEFAESLAFIEQNNHLQRLLPKSKKQTVAVRTTQTPIKVDVEIFESVKAFKERHKLRNIANIFYALSLLALKEFE